MCRQNSAGRKCSWSRQKWKRCNSSYLSLWLVLLRVTYNSYWDGLRAFEADKHDYLQGQIGNPTGPDKPNKKFYDPRVWIRKAEESMIKRCGVAMDKLSTTGTYEPKIPEPGSLPVYGFKPLGLAGQAGQAVQEALQKVGL